MAILVDEIKVSKISAVLKKIEHLKLSVIKVLSLIDDLKTNREYNEDLYGYEILMKDYYINNGDRHRISAEESLILADEAEKNHRNY